MGGGREVQEGGDSCIPIVDSCWCMQKPTQYYKAVIFQLKINHFFKLYSHGINLGLLDGRTIVLSRGQNMWLNIQSHSASIYPVPIVATNYTKIMKWRGFKRFWSNPLILGLKHLKSAKTEGLYNKVPFYLCQLWREDKAKKTGEMIGLWIFTFKYLGGNITKMAQS